MLAYRNADNADDPRECVAELVELLLEGCLFGVVLRLLQGYQSHMLLL